MRIKQKHTNKELSATYQYWKEHILAKHVEENYDILSHPEIVDLYEIDTKTGIKKYFTTTDKHIAIQQYLSKSDTYLMKDTSAEFDTYYRMTTKPTGALTAEIINAFTNHKQPQKKEQKMQQVTKIFISHSSKDMKLVGELIDLIETIGVDSKDIFCSSFEGYGVSLGENFLERLRNELNNNVLVIFVLSQNFYESPICLCEMGATWIKTNEHIPILIPPFDYEKIKGVIQNIHGLKINEPLKLNLLKERLEEAFNLNPINNTRWESKRNNILDRIDKIINQPKTLEPKKIESKSTQESLSNKLNNSLQMIIIYAQENELTAISFQKIMENINPKFNENYIMNLVEENPLILRRYKLKSGQFGVKINFKNI
jgi:TIR domain-containing protein